jgi:hypothetical protein
MNTNDFQAVLVNVDGTAETVRWTATADEPHYKHLQKYVGGLVDVVSIAPDMDAWVNDDGIMLGLEPNLHATFLLSYLTDRQLAQPLFGPVVFTGGADADGETQPLTDEAVELFHKAVGILSGLTGTETGR